MPVLGSAIPYVRASYPEADDADPAELGSATQRAATALFAFQGELAALRSAGLPSMVAQALYRTYVNGAITHLLRGQLLETDWCDLWDHHVERFCESLVYAEEPFSTTQRSQLHLPLASELGGCGFQSARWSMASYGRPWPRMTAQGWP